MTIRCLCESDGLTGTVDVEWPAKWGEFTPSTDSDGLQELVSQTVRESGEWSYFNMRGCSVESFEVIGQCAECAGTGSCPILSAQDEVIGETKCPACGGLGSLADDQGARPRGNT